MLGRISTSSAYDSTITQLNERQAEIADIRRQISSGIKPSTFADMGADTVRFLNLESSIGGLEKFRSQNVLTLSRMNIMSSSLTKMQELADEVAQQIVTKRSISGNNLDLTSFAELTRDRLAGILNIRSEGRYLFSGSKTNIAPVNENNLNNLDTNLNAVSNYYQGNDIKIAIKTSKQQTVAYGVTANESAFVNLMGSINMLLQDNTETNMESAMSMINAARESLADIHSRIGVSMQQVESANDQHDSVIGQLSSLRDETVGVDIAEATIRLSENEVVLQASFQTFARISRLTLAEYLR